MTSPGAIGGLRIGWVSWISGRGWPTLALLSVGCCTWTCAVLVALRNQPSTALAVGVAPVLLALLCLSSWVRVLVVVAGGVLVLGSEDVGAPKVVYGALLVLCAAISGCSLITHRPAWAVRFRTLIVPGVLFMAFLVYGALVSPLGWSSADVARGSVFWLVILVAPLIGLDAARSMSVDVATAFAMAVCAVSVVGFAVRWLSSRGATSDLGGSLALSSAVLPALGLAIAFVRGADAPGRSRLLVWAPLGVFMLGGVLITGSREGLLLLVVLIASLGPRRWARVPPSRALSMVLSMAAVAVLLVPPVAAAVITNPEFVASRLNALGMVTSGNVVYEASFIERQEQAAAAQVIVAAHPWFGLGAGWVLDQTLDTQWVTVVRIGWVGVASLLLFFGLTVVEYVRSARGGRATIAHTVAGAVFAYCASMLVIASPVDDHGFGFALMLMFLLFGAHLRAAGPQQSLPLDAQNVTGARARVGSAS